MEVPALLPGAVVHDEMVESSSAIATPNSL